jgi:dihydrofolate synthase/folylpolyglutamate synthase
VTGADADRSVDADDRFGQIQQALLHRWPEDRIAPSLDRMRAVVELLGDPHRAFPVIHVAGTNGKTTVSRMIDALLTAFGITTGRITSPHLQSVRERIVLVGEPISAERFAEVYDDIEPYLQMVDAQSIGQGGPAMSTFEVLTTLGFAAFADAPVDVGIVEVGMGGTWDATNVVDAAVSVITPIGIDHVDYLGGTLSAIAAEKAGIIKDGGIAVLAGQDPDAAQVLLSRVATVGATAVAEGLDFGVVERRVAVGGQQVTLQGLGGLYDEIFLPLHGQHQAQNAAIALAAVESFLGGGQRTLDIELVRDGFAAVSSPGRMEVVRRSPTVVVDAAHNPDGFAVSLAAVREAFDFPRLIVVLGVLADKDLAGMLDHLARVADHVVVTQPTSPRALPADEAADLARSVLGDHRVSEHASLPSAVETAVALADDPDHPPAGILVLGSVVLAGEVRTLLGADR